MLDRLTLDSFQPYLNQTFRAQWEPSGSLDLTMVECTYFGFEGRVRQQFQVLFIGPLQPALPQRTYRMHHEQMGDFDLFIVPIGPDARGLRYQAIFT